jgi:ROK family
MKKQIASPKLLGKTIGRSIRTSLLDLGSATKVELSRSLGISFPTISKFISEMEKDGEILQLGLDGSSGGRRAKRYSYNAEYMYGLALFLEKTETNYTIFNCQGEVKEKGKVGSVLAEGGLHLLTECIEGLLKKFPKISSIALGVPGSVDGERIFYIPGYDEYQDMNLKGYCEERFRIRTVVENDMNASVLGYSHCKGSQNQSLVYLYAGQNGPGAGIMINGEVVRGKSFFSGEVSFVPLYNEWNFQQAMEFRANKIDAMSRLVASFSGMINPHAFVFCEGDVSLADIEEISRMSSTYIPSEHLPELTISDLQQDYLYGLQQLCLDLMMDGASA